MERTWGTSDLMNRPPDFEPLMAVEQPAPCTVPACENPPQEASAEQHAANLFTSVPAAAAHFAVVVFLFEAGHVLVGSDQNPGGGGGGGGGAGVGLSFVHVPMCFPWTNPLHVGSCFGQIFES